MIMINEQITTLREISTDTDGCCYPQEYLQKVIGSRLHHRSLIRKTASGEYG